MEGLIVVLLMAAWIAILYGALSYKCRRDWNGGKCRKCGAQWERGFTDSQGHTLYSCSERCGDSIYIWDWAKGDAASTGDRA